MQRDSEGVDQPESSRHRSHHKSRPPTYCYCMRCDGKVVQKSRTIEDHKTRYPRSQGSFSVELEMEDNRLPESSTAELLDKESSGVEPSGDKETDGNNSPHLPGIHSSPELLPIQLASPAIGDHLRKTQRSPRSLDSHALSEISNIDVEMLDVEINERPDNQSLQDKDEEEEEDMGREYPFEELLDDAYDNFMHHGLIDILDEHHFEQEEDDADDIIDDEDFGLPNGQGGHEEQPPPFQFQIGEEIIEEPDQELGDDPLDLEDGAGDPLYPPKPRNFRGWKTGVEFRLFRIWHPKLPDPRNAAQYPGEVQIFCRRDLRRFR